MHLAIISYNLHRQQRELSLFSLLHSLCLGQSAQRPNSPMENGKWIRNWIAKLTLAIKRSLSPETSVYCDASVYVICLLFLLYLRRKWTRVQWAVYSITRRVALTAPYGPYPEDRLLMSRTGITGVSMSFAWRNAVLDVAIDSVVSLDALSLSSLSLCLYYGYGHHWPYPDSDLPSSIALVRGTEEDNRRRKQCSCRRWWV